MTQYVIQIQVKENGNKVGWLAKSFKVTPTSPIPTSWSPLFVQVVLTNTQSFNEIVAVYAEYKLDVIFGYDDEPVKKIYCGGAVTKEWPVD